MKESARKNNASKKLIGSNNMIVYRISNALKVKYKNLFASIGYNESELISDVEKFLITKYKTKTPKEAFKPIEEEILTNIRSKYKLSNLSNTAKKSKSHQRNIKIRPQLKTENVTDNTIQVAKPLEPQIVHTVPTEPERKDDVDDDYNEPHELRDRLRMRMENDYMAKYLKEQNEKFEAAEKAKYNEKLLEQKKMYEFLQQQINERNSQIKRQLEEDKKLKQLQDENYSKFKENEKLQHKQKQKLQLELQTNFQLQQQHLKTIQSEAPHPLYTMNPRGYFNDDASRHKQEQFRSQFLKDCETYRNEREAFIAKQKEIQRKEDERFIRQCDEVAKRKLNDEDVFIKKRVADRMRSQEVAEEHLRGLYLKKNKSAIGERYLKEREEEEKRKIKECEMADMKRREKMVEMIKSFDGYLERKEKEKERRREVNREIREKEKEMYREYVKEVEEEKRKKEEVLRKYREDLKKQIEDNKRRQIEEYKNSFGIVPKSYTTIKTESSINENDIL